MSEPDAGAPPAARVRKFNDADLGAVCRIYANAKRDELAYEGKLVEIIPLEEDAVIMAAFRESDVFVYEDGGVVGFAAMFDGQLRALFVHDDARGRGVGRALLDAALARAPGGLSLYVAASNLNARQFYERRGFAVTGHAYRHYNGIDVSYLQMSSPSV